MRNIIIILSVAIVGVSLLLYFLMFHGSLSGSTEEFSRFGDYVGGTIGATMALLSAYLIYLTYKQQVDFSREQMVLSRRSQFEGNFYQLLQVQRDIAKTLVVKKRSSMRQDTIVSYTGVEAISHAAEDVRQVMLEFGYMASDVNSYDFEQIRHKVDELFTQAIDTYGEQSLSHYFRHLYHIIKYIDNSEVSNKEEYIGIMQAQLTNDELYLLFFDALSKYGYPKFYRLVEGYGMLENLHYHDFDYFKILQKKCYPGTYFKHSPNNAVLIVGFFDKMRGEAMIRLCQHFGACLLEIQTKDFSQSNSFMISIAGGGKFQVNHLADVIKTDVLYLVDSSFVSIDNGKINRIPIRVFKEMNPAGIIFCHDNPIEIKEAYKNNGRFNYDEDDIKDIIKQEEQICMDFCDNFNIPYVKCDSDDFQSMGAFISMLN